MGKFKPNAVEKPVMEKAFLVRATDELHRKVKIIAAENGLSINALTVQMIEHCLKDMSKGDES